MFCKRCPKCFALNNSSSKDRCCYEVWIWALGRIKTTFSCSSCPAPHFSYSRLPTSTRNLPDYCSVSPYSWDSLCSLSCWSTAVYSLPRKPCFMRNHLSIINYSNNAVSLTGYSWRACYSCITHSWYFFFSCASHDTDLKELFLLPHGAHYMRREQGGYSSQFLPLLVINVKTLLIARHCYNHLF